MKFRCPYCKHVFDAELRSICPHCGRTMIIPPPLKKKTSGSILHRSSRRKSGREPSISVPDLQFGRKPLSILLMLAVMIVIGGMVIGRAKLKFQPAKKRSPLTVAVKELTVLDIALECFRRDCGRYPATEEGLKALIINPGVQQWNGPYVTLIKPDPWKHHYHYSLENGEITLFSCGPDGIERTPDDIY